MDKNQLIGKNNELPWHYKEDLKYFRACIKDHPVLLGDNTYLSILGYRNGKKFPDSKHYVATIKDVDFEDCTMVRDVIAFLEEPHDEEIFVIGGATIYKLALPYADRLYITHIDKEYEGDAYFPHIDFDQFNKVSERVSGELTFAVYERK
jgi:dihydrofolate reductase